MKACAASLQPSPPSLCWRTCGSTKFEFETSITSDLLLALPPSITRLHLSGCIVPQQAMSIVPQHLPNLRQLRFEDCFGEYENFNIYDISLLSTVRHLTILELSCMYLEQQRGELLTAAVAHLTNLKQLHIVDCDFWSQHLRNLTSLEQLTLLDLSQNIWYSDAARGGLQHMSLLTTLSSLEVLNLQGTCLPEKVSAAVRQHLSPLPRSLVRCIGSASAGQKEGVHALDDACKLQLLHY